VSIPGVQLITRPFSQEFAYSSEIFAPLCTSEDAKEGVDAFTAKGKPVWQGK